MRYALRHVTRFAYDFPVRFARCNLRLHPIDCDGQAMEHHALTIEPAATVTRGRDNGYRANSDRLVVERPASKLTIDSRSTVVVDRVAPVALADDPTIADAALAAREARDLGPMAPANYKMM